MTYLYIEKDGELGVFDQAPGDNAWTDESEWQELADGSLRVVRFDGAACEEMQPDGTWVPVKGWYRT